MSRRALLASTSVVLSAASGCAALTWSPNSSDRDADPHWVKMYLADRDETHNVTVTITNEGGTAVFEKEYQISDSNEADEDATFPASTEPETIEVTVDGTRFERDWPGFERPKLPCDGANEAGVEIRVENGQDGTPNIRLLADCQSITGE